MVEAGFPCLSIPYWADHVGIKCTSPLWKNGWATRQFGKFYKCCPSGCDDEFRWNDFFHIPKRGINCLHISQLILSLESFAHLIVASRFPSRPCLLHNVASVGCCRCSVCSQQFRQGVHPSFVTRALQQFRRHGLDDDHIVCLSTVVVTVQYP